MQKAILPATHLHSHCMWHEQIHPHISHGRAERERLNKSDTQEDLSISRLEDSIPEVGLCSKPVLSVLFFSRNRWKGSPAKSLPELEKLEGCQIDSGRPQDVQPVGQ